MRVDRGQWCYTPKSHLYTAETMTTGLIIVEERAIRQLDTL